MKPAGRNGLSFAFDIVPIGLEYIAAYIEDVVEDIHIVDMEMDQRSFLEIMSLYRPNLVCITMSATEHNSGLHLAEIAKTKGAATIVGGYHPTGIPDLLLSYPQIDMVVRGEGEITVRELVEKGSPENVLGLSYKKDGQIIHNGERPVIQDLDALPFPARHLRQYLYKTGDGFTDYDVLTMSRGCLNPCIFCCEPNMSQRQMRCRSPESVMKEIHEIAAARKGRPVSIMFTDPNFIGYPDRVSRLCELLIESNLNVKFHAILRPNIMATQPQLVKKMCNAGILWYEMGIESPNLKDLKQTKKGISNKIHREAVRNIRAYGGNAGGTFVIGLPDQTEEEIRGFPAYAREIGLTSAAFGIATPFPGTEFYDDLDKQGLIFETNWNNFDEMHSVYRTKHVPKEKVEELATYCMAKFWNIDTFIDWAQVSMKRTGRKQPLMEFIRERTVDLHFITNNGVKLQKSNFASHIKTFLDAYPDPRIEEYTRKVGVHNVLEMSRFLRILGPNTVQCTLRLDDTRISFVIKTTSNTVEYIRVIHGKEEDSTIDFDIDLSWMNDQSPKSAVTMAQRLISVISHDFSIKRLRNILRLFLAVGTELVVSRLISSKQ
ncbi:MAG: B12-binding domain-containing radical SAM protein [Thaumarchaeota archaeon]|nr:B12-binding domain-containing radical SAM protein [Nitrososphaerota archaeon]MCL5316718.1 B12-binding domain-containing radical SAM protein [Nitrososphaerota archaeon]